MTFTATPIIKNKIWFVEHNGEYIASIMGSRNGVDLIKSGKKEPFSSLSMLKNKYNIIFTKQRHIEHKDKDVCGYPCAQVPYNPALDLTRNLPVYHRDPNSKSYYCAGYYSVLLGGKQVVTFCPKLLVLTRNKYYGPFKTKAEAIKVNYLEDNGGTQNK